MSAPQPIRSVVVMPSTEYLGEGLSRAERDARNAAADMAKERGRVLLASPAIYRESEVEGLTLNPEVVALCFEWQTEAVKERGPF